MEIGTVFTATFAPRRTDDLQPDGLPPVGTRQVWRVQWVIEADRPYGGELECLPWPPRAESWRWVPSGDLRDVTVMPAPPVVSGVG